MKVSHRTKEAAAPEFPCGSGHIELFTEEQPGKRAGGPSTSARVFTVRPAGVKAKMPAFDTYDDRITSYQEHLTFVENATGVAVAIIAQRPVVLAHNTHLLTVNLERGLQRTFVEVVHSSGCSIRFNKLIELPVRES